MSQEGRGRDASPFSRVVIPGREGKSILLKSLAPLEWEYVDFPYDPLKLPESPSRGDIPYCTTSNVVTRDTALLGVVKQYEEEEISWLELMKWLHRNVRRKK